MTCPCRACRPVAGRLPAWAADGADLLEVARRCQGEAGEAAREHLLARGWVACSSCGGLGHWEPAAPIRNPVNALSLDDGEVTATRDGWPFCEDCDGSGLERRPDDLGDACTSPPSSARAGVGAPLEPWTN